MGSGRSLVNSLPDKGRVTSEGGHAQPVLSAAHIPEGCNVWSGYTQPAKVFDSKSHQEKIIMKKKAHHGS